MPFTLIPTALGIAFFLMWAFIAGMLLRDSRLAAQQERDDTNHLLPLSLERPRKTRRAPLARLAS